MYKPYPSGIGGDREYHCLFMCARLPFPSFHAQGTTSMWALSYIGLFGMHVLSSTSTNCIYSMELVLHEQIYDEVSPSIALKVGSLLV
jgi:hypothetical protein